MKCLFPCLCAPETDAKTSKKQLDGNLLAEKEKAIRILLLGPGSSGKSTIVKQIKKIHHCNEPYKEQGLAKYIKSAVVANMKILCEHSLALHEKYDLDTLVDPDNEPIRSEMAGLHPPHMLTPEIAFKIRVLWADEGIQKTLNHRRYFQIQENAEHFFKEIDVISSPTFAPSFDDYLRFRQTTLGLSQTKIKINFGGGFGDQTFEFTDVGGQRSERRKARYASEDANAVIFVVGLSDYDLTCFEDNTTNRLQESIHLFRDVMINQKLYLHRTVFLFFNKYDLFEEKIKKVPITVALDDFPADLNPNDAADVVKVVGARFLNVFRDANVPLHGPLHIMRTTALDTNMVDKIFSDVTLDLVQRNLSGLNLL
eukprot:61777_1